jgi:hypothetical protein
MTLRETLEDLSCLGAEPGKACHSRRLRLGGLEGGHFEGIVEGPRRREANPPLPDRREACEGNVFEITHRNAPRTGRPGTQTNVGHGALSKRPQGDEVRNVEFDKSQCNL